MISSRNARLAAARLFAMASVLLWLSSCGSSGGGTITGTGGDIGSGGSSSIAGTTGAGGMKGTGGATSVGGTIGTGGAKGPGGPTGTGDTTGTGGSAATGGTTGTAGTIGSGGTSATAGSNGTGGAKGPGGTTGAGGGIGSGGAGTGGSATGGSSGTCPATALKAGDNNESITSGGESRTFIVHVPPGYAGISPVPVVLDFHGLGGTGSQQAGLSGGRRSVTAWAALPFSLTRPGRPPTTLGMPVTAAATPRRIRSTMSSSRET